MKKTIQLLTLLFTCGTIFSQQKLHDGIYLVDQYTKSKHAYSQSNRSIVQFNPAFVNEDPENYGPLVIYTDNYFSFDLAGQPYIQSQDNQSRLLVLQLTETAKEKLELFTSINLMKEIVVVVNDQVLVMYKITAPITSGLIKITKCDGQACRQILKNIKAPAKI